MKQLRNFRQPDKAGVNNGIQSEVDQAISKFGNMDEDALINQLMTNVAKSRSDGTYNPQAMTGFMSTIAPHLTKQQKTKLENLINLMNAEYEQK